jgi:lipoprotein NlpD
VLAGLQVACGVASRAPVEDRADRQAPAAGQHLVRPGDTLYGIAWMHGLDYQDVAAWNGIPPPYRIYPGRRLRLSGPERPADARPAPPAPVAAAPTVPAPAAGPAPRGAPSRPVPPGPAGGRPSGPRDSAATADEHAGAVVWTWPARGRVLRTFADAGNKGLDIGGRMHQPIYAAAPGQVVYSGSGLIGYGKLIIIKHNKNYLSAYAHNERLLVGEGDSVSAGQRIAEMGRSGATQVKLHFEIRRDGKPVDPLRYLPKAEST